MNIRKTYDIYHMTYNIYHITYNIYQISYNICHITYQHNIMLINTVCMYVCM